MRPSPMWPISGPNPFQLTDGDKVPHPRQIMGTHYEKIIDGNSLVWEPVREEEQHQLLA
jgi:hypothetical protein